MGIWYDDPKQNSDAWKKIILFTGFVGVGVANYFTRTIPIPFLTRAEPYDVRVVYDGYEGYRVGFTDAIISSLEAQETRMVHEQVDDQATRLDFDKNKKTIAFTSLDQALLNTKGDASIIAGSSRSQGSDCIFTNPSHGGSFANLIKKGNLTVALPVGSPAEHLLRSMKNLIKNNQITYDYKYAAEDSANAATYIDEADLTVVWQPECNQLLDKGYNLLISSQQLPSSIMDVAVTSKEMMEKHPEVVKAYLTEFYAQTSDLIGNTSKRPQLLRILQTDPSQSGIRLFNYKSIQDWIRASKFQEAKSQVEEVLGYEGEKYNTNLRFDLSIADQVTKDLLKEKKASLPKFWPDMLKNFNAPPQPIRFNFEPSNYTRKEEFPVNTTNFSKLQEELSAKYPYDKYLLIVKSDKIENADYIAKSLMDWGGEIRLSTLKEDGAKTSIVVFEDTGS